MTRTSPHTLPGTGPPEISPRAASWSSLRSHLPLLVFTAVYLFSCYAGVLALMLSIRFRTLYFIFSGSDPVPLSRRDVLIVIALLNVPPLALWGGYGLVLRWLRGSRRLVAGDDRSLTWLLRAAFACSALAAVFSLARVGGVGGSLTAWLDYNAYVFERWRWFDSLGFLEFVNLYTFLPLAAAGLLLSERNRFVGVAAVIATLTLQYPLAIRKVLLTTLLLAAFSAAIYWTFGATPRWPVSRRFRWRMALAGGVGLYAVYVGLTLMTILGPGGRAFQSVAALVPRGQAREARLRREEDERRMAASSGLDALALETGITDEGMTRVLQSRVASVALFTIWSPFTRSSICVLVYPVIFPRWHPYYRFDVGLDILGWGSMPDDNLVVYRYLWPDHHRGSVAAPFHVVLYSQGGLLIAILGALLAGAALAVAWVVVGWSEPRPGVCVSLWGGLVLTLGVFLAIDSLRNSLVVSYGLAWGLVAVVGLSAAARLFQGRLATPAPADR